MESPYHYVLGKFGIKGDTENIWGYHIYQEVLGDEPHEFGYGSFEAAYALPLDGYFILMKREQDFFAGYVDKPIRIMNFDQVDKIERILYMEVKDRIIKFENKFNQGNFTFIRTVRDSMSFAENNLKT